MPIYEFKCQKCGKKFERFIRISDKKDAKDELTCPYCGTDQVKRIYSFFGTSSSCGDTSHSHSFG